MYSLSSVAAIWLVIVSLLSIIILLFSFGTLRWVGHTRKPPAEARENDIVPLADFDLQSVDPIKYRPWRTQGHVSMGMLKENRSNWIRMDNGYISRIRSREVLIQEKPEFIIGTGTLVNPAIEDLYIEVMIKYLPYRYPTMFRIVRTGATKTVLNLVTGSTYPLSTASLTPEKMLELLGRNVEEDFYFMCPDPEDGEHRLRGYIACFPGGFLSPARLGESVREIHQPVPGYESRLGRGADKFFQRLKPGEFVGRMNWSLQVDGEDLFRVDGNNYYPEKDEVVAAEKFGPDFSQCFLRVEHQTLTRLPRSRAVVFCVRSYMTPLAQIKREGEGPDLARAIESMPEKLGLYKMRHIWGSKVLPWLKEDELESS